MSLQSKRELEVTRKKLQELEQLYAKTEADSPQSGYSRDLTLRSLRRTINQFKEKSPALSPHQFDGHGQITAGRGTGSAAAFGAAFLAIARSDKIAEKGSRHDFEYGTTKSRVENGEPVALNVAGHGMRSAPQGHLPPLDPDYDTGPWTVEEMNLLANEAEEMISGGNPMNIERGQVISAPFPHASGARGKKRPVVVGPD